MARSKKMVVSEESTDKNDAIAHVMGAGLDALVQHNAHLIKVDAHKDELLMQIARQAQEERVQFARVQNTMIEKFSETLDSIQKLKDREYEREEKREEAKFMRGLKERGYSDLRQLGTIALNQFAGRPMVKESERGLVAELVVSIKDEQLAALQGIFTEGQMAAFAKIYKEVQEQVKEPGDTEEESSANGGSNDARH